MKRRYVVALGGVSLTLALVALGTIATQADIYTRLIPYYQSSDFSVLEEREYQSLQQMSSALYDLGPWAILAAIVPVIVALAVAMVAARRPDSGAGTRS